MKVLQNGLIIVNYSLNTNERENSIHIRSFRVVEVSPAGHGKSLPPYVCDQYLPVGRSSSQKIDYCVQDGQRRGKWQIL